jgi:uncharacterized membrane protein
MSNLIVITFDDPDQAGQVREALRSAEHGDFLSLDDSAVVVRDEEGKVHIKSEVDRGVKVGAVGGGFLGLLLAGIFFPVGGLIVGAIGGALVGAAFKTGIDKKFIAQVTDELQPGTSAIFILVREANADVALASLKPYKGTVYSTTLSPEDEEEIRHILKRKI